MQAVSKGDYHDHATSSNKSKFKMKSLLDSEERELDADDTDTDTEQELEPDIDTYLPALADASDCDTLSTCSDQDSHRRHSQRHSNAYANAITATNNTRAGDSYLQSKKSLPSSLTDADSTNAQGSLPPPTSSTSLSATCASLFCISELFSWDGNANANANANANDGTDQDTLATEIEPVTGHQHQPQHPLDDTNINTNTRANTTNTNTNTHAHAHAQDTYRYLQTLQSTIQNEILAFISTNMNMTQYCPTILCCPNGMNGNPNGKNGNRTGNANQQHGNANQHLSMSRSTHGQMQQQHMQRIGNRNVYQREKARKRIEALRESGLSKNFSLRSVSMLLEEEVSEYGSVSESSATSHGDRLGHEDGHGHGYGDEQGDARGHGHGDEHGHGHGDAHGDEHEHEHEHEHKLRNAHIFKKAEASTFYSRSGRGRIGSSKSIDWSAVQLERSRERRQNCTWCWGGNRHGHDCDGHGHGHGNGDSHGHQYGKDSGTYFLGCTDSNVGTRTRMNGNSNQTIVAVPTFDSVESEEELYYDSDPGPEINDITSVAGTRKATRKAGERGTKKKECTAAAGQCTKGEKEEKRPSRTPKMLLQTYHVPSFDINNAHMVSQLISELVTGSYTFIWHPNDASFQQIRSTPQPQSPPLFVKCWFELGSCLKNTLVQPKFIWRVIASKETSRKQSIKAIQAPQSVELLNVLRLLVPIEVDRSIYPFVKPKNSFMIMTNEEKEYVFEAKIEEGGKRFLFAMKLMIARLASKIIVGDKDVFDEFFTPTGKRKEDVGCSPHSYLEVEDESVASGKVGSICNVIVAPVNVESGRNEELWGKSGY